MVQFRPTGDKRQGNLKETGVKIDKLKDFKLTFSFCLSPCLMANHKRFEITSKSKCNKNLLNSRRPREVFIFAS